jgi:hypothetical protein
MLSIFNEKKLSASNHKSKFIIQIRRRPLIADRHGMQGNNMLPRQLNALIHQSQKAFDDAINERDVPTPDYLQKSLAFQSFKEVMTKINGTLVLTHDPNTTESGIIENILLLFITNRIDNVFPSPTSLITMITELPDVSLTDQMNMFER